MQRLGLDASEYAAYVRTLRSTHERRVRVDLTTLSGGSMSDLSDVRILDGQVTVDGASDVTRSLSLTFFDPENVLDFDTDSPNNGALFLDRMVRVRYGVFVEDLDRWVDCTVFHGPITQLSRDGVKVNVEAQGKEALAMGNTWGVRTFRKGMRKHEVIRQILRDFAGENRFAISEFAGTLPSPLSLNADLTPWENARKVAAGMTRQLFYNGAGVCTLRAYPGSALYTFTDGDGGDLLSEVSASYSADIKNHIIVTGKKPTNKKKAAPKAAATAPNSSGLSPSRLGRNGVPRYIVERIQNNSVTSVKEAREYAERILEDRLRNSVEVSFDALPIPHLDPGDLVSVRSEQGSFTFRLTQFTIPLVSGAMNVGYTARPKPKRSKIR